VAGSSTWNSLPESRRRTDSTETFKHCLTLKTQFLTSTLAPLHFNFHCFIDFYNARTVRLIDLAFEKLWSS